MATGSRGFTLIEVLVVVLLMVIVVGMVGLKIGGDEGRAVRQEADRLSVLLQTAQQEAILQGKVLALAMQEEGYEFQGLDVKRKFTPLNDPVLRPRELPPAMSIISLTLDNVPAGKDGRIILYPTGELPQAFVITLGQGEARWQVRGALNGTIQSAAPDEPNAPNA
jgi:general secretion pathway protein H